MSFTRRRFIGAAGALAAGALLGGCGADDEATPTASADAELLAELLAGERAAIAALAVVPGAVAVRDQDRRHAARLERELSARGGRADIRPPADPAPAMARKQENVFAYVAALPRFSDPELRTLVMELVASEAEHLAVLRLDAGEDAVPDAFAGFVAAEIA